MDNTQFTFTANNPLKLLKNLATEQYSDSIAGTVMEWASNAIDETKTSGSNVPVEVTLTKEQFTVRDYGRGIDDTVMEVIMDIGGSTKTKGETIGDKGVGIFAAFGVRNQFEIKSSVNRYTVTDKGTVKKVSDVDLPYTEISLEIDNDDTYDAFYLSIKRLLPYHVLAGDVVVNNVIMPESPTLFGNGWAALPDSYNSSFTVLINNFPYKLDSNKIKGFYNSNVRGVVFTPNFDVPRTTSRESIIYNDDTINKLTQSVEDISNEIDKILNIQFDTMTQFEDVMNMGLWNFIKIGTSNYKYQFRLKGVGGKPFVTRNFGSTYYLLNIEDAEIKLTDVDYSGKKETNFRGNINCIGRRGLVVAPYGKSISAGLWRTIKEMGATVVRCNVEHVKAFSFGSYTLLSELEPTKSEGEVFSFNTKDNDGEYYKFDLKEGVLESEYYLSGNWAMFPHSQTNTKEYHKAKAMGYSIYVISSQANNTRFDRLNKDNVILASQSNDINVRFAPYVERWKDLMEKYYVGYTTDVQPKLLLDSGILPNNLEKRLIERERGVKVLQGEQSTFLHNLAKVFGLDRRERKGCFIDVLEKAMNKSLPLYSQIVYNYGCSDTSNEEDVKYRTHAINYVKSCKKGFLKVCKKKGLID